MSQELKKVIKIAKETGDRIIVFDPEESGDNFVVLSLEEYEKLIKYSAFKGGYDTEKAELKNLTENELIDKINRDIAVWKNENEGKRLDSYKIIESFLQTEPELEKEEGEVGSVPESRGEDNEEDNFYYYNDSEEGEDRNNRSWDIPVDIKKGAEEVKE